MASLRQAAVLERDPRGIDSSSSSSGSSPASETTLASLRVGRRGRIKGILPTCVVRRRLLEMGLTPGVEVTVDRIAPMGDPIKILVRGYRLSIRRQDAECIICRM